MPEINRHPPHPSGPPGLDAPGGAAPAEIDSGGNSVSEQAVIDEPLDPVAGPKPPAPPESDGAAAPGPAATDRRPHTDGGHHTTEDRARTTDAGHGAAEAGTAVSDHNAAEHHPRTDGEHSTVEGRPRTAGTERDSTATGVDVEARAERLRKARVGVLVAATAVSVLMILLFAAALRNDYLIESEKGETTGEVLSAGRLRSAVMYVTPDGITHNPKVGVLYPTNLTAGERINVEYSRADPDLVRVAGRDARVAVEPVLSVLAVTWLLALPTLWLLLRAGTGSNSVRPIFDPVSYRRRRTGPAAGEH